MNQNIKNIFKVALLLVAMPIFSQQGGMWIPSLLEGMNQEEMATLGMKMSISDIYDVNNSSLKDAVPHFNGGCTSEVISPNGLLLTNHHCGYGQIQAHSTIENDYLQDGFWAKDKSQELVNENLSVTFMVKIQDVTTEVTKGIKPSDSEKVKKDKIAKNIEKTIKTFPKQRWQENRIKAFYEGNQYILFVTETFKDVRLVGTPPSSIGKFGSDTDNWVWPRHTGDFALFRIYADKNNKPAEYSPDNVPYTPKHYFPISLDGVSPDDFTMVFGYPGRTQEYLPSFAVEQITESLNPARIGIRDISLKITDQFMREDQGIKIQYASKFAGTANYWKKWIGESQGLKKSNAVQAKQDFEKDFVKRASQNTATKQYADLIPAFEKLYAQITPYAVSKEYYSEIALRNAEILSMASRVYAIEKSLDNAKNFETKKQDILDKAQNFYKNYSTKVDKEVFQAMIQKYAKDAPKEFLPKNLVNINAQELTNEIFAESALTSYQGLQELLQGDAKQVLEKLNQDKGYSFAKEIFQNYNQNILPVYQDLEQQISALQRVYMKAQLELYPEARIFPDANGTLRVTYGIVDGYSPSDAVYYEPITHLDGIMEKYVPGDYEFDVPQKLIELYQSKDYGNYAQKDGKLPVNFISTAHTTGGNSGSPALDAYGNLVGLNFDRVWEGTMSDIYYDPSICRNIMVDARYILFIIDKFAGAHHLIEEMELVYPKDK
ncbi:S46 family peptidase [Myroides sp. LJL115]